MQVATWMRSLGAKLLEMFTRKYAFRGNYQEIFIAHVINASRQYSPKLEACKLGI